MGSFRKSNCPGQVHKSQTADLKKNMLCREHNIELIRLRERGCPQIDSFAIDVVPMDNASLASALTQLIQYLATKYGVVPNTEVNLERDSQLILRNVYLSKKDKSLSKTYPVVAALLHNKNSLNPDTIPCYSNRMLEWACPDCGYIWNAMVYSVVNSYKKAGKTGCPKCAGKVRVVGENDAATLDPIAASCWDNTRNSDRLCDHRVGDSQCRYWTCVECGKPFQRRICVMCRPSSLHACVSCSKKLAQKNREVSLKLD